MLKVFDYQCSDGHVFEVFTADSQHTAFCRCGQPAKRIVSAPAFILPANAGFPGKDDRWIREHERAGKLNDVDPRNGTIRDVG